MEIDGREVMSVKGSTFAEMLAKMKQEVMAQ